MHISLHIERLSSFGDGVARYDGRNLYLPYACPGDKVAAALSPEQNAAHIIDVITPSKDRVAPDCKHFGKCGGCRLQHIARDRYIAFKQNMLDAICRRLGVKNGAAPVQSAGYGSRTRVRLHVVAHKKDITLGFRAEKSEETINIDECPICAPGIADSLPEWRAALSEFKKPGRVSALSLSLFSEGVDAVLHVKTALHKADAEKLRDMATALNLARLSITDDVAQNAVIYTRRVPTLRCGDVPVVVPAGGFMQATEKGRMILADFVASRLAPYSRIADLYSGCGNYSFPLAKRAATLTAYEGDAEAVAALHDAGVKYMPKKAVSAHCRDLYVNPLTPKELENYDAVCINPPRNGAGPQCKNIAASAAQAVAYVSCNPVSFERDAGILIKGGFRLREAVPVDQFYMTPKLEIAAMFTR